jgi:hypothetical protein
MLAGEGGRPQGGHWCIMSRRRREIEPLFRPLAFAPLADGEARCTSCHLVRPMVEHPCPSCGHVEYELAKADGKGKPR